MSCPDGGIRLLKMNLFNTIGQGYSLIKEYLTSQLVLQARQLWLNLNVTWEQMKIAQENLELAEKTTYDQMARFNAGLVPLSDVLTNQTTLLEATENLIDKQIEYSKALTAYNGRK